MNKLLLTTLLFLNVSASADCFFYLEKESFIYAGYPLEISRFVADTMYDEHQCQATDDKENADIILSFDYNIVDKKYFQYSISKGIAYSSKSDQSQEFTFSKRCWYMNCSIYEVAKSFKGSIKKLIKNLEI